MFKIDLQQVSIILCYWPVYNMCFYCVKIGLKLIRTSMCFALSGKNRQKCQGTDLSVELLSVVEN